MGPPYKCYKNETIIPFKGIYIYVYISLSLSLLGHAVCGIELVCIGVQTSKLGSILKPLDKYLSLYSYLSIHISICLSVDLSIYLSEPIYIHTHRERERDTHTHTRTKKHTHTQTQRHSCMCVQPTGLLTRRLHGSSVFVMTCFLPSGYNILPEKELHESLWVRKRTTINLPCTV